jgi:hypothetical protein
MAAIIFKWFLLLLLLPGGGPGIDKAMHPVYLSVTEIEHNKAEKLLEVSCKIYTDDFEKTLRMHYTDKIDLMNTAAKKAMTPLINDYLQKHLWMAVDDKKVQLRFIDYELQDEGIVCFLQAESIITLKKLKVFNNLLYEYKEQQMGIIHAIVNGNRKSTRLNNPDANALFEF